MLTASRDAFVLSSAMLFILLCFAAVSSDGVNAVAAITGILLETPSEASLRIAVASDMVIPFAYGAGFILLAIGLADDEKSRLVAGAVIFLASLGIIFDVVENGLALNATEYNAISIMFITTAKYAAGTLAGCLVSTLFSPGLVTTTLGKILFRFITPIVLSVTFLLIAGELGVWLLLIGLIITFLFAACLAQSEHNHRNNA